MGQAIQQPVDHGTQTLAEGLARHELDASRIEALGNIRMVIYGNYDIRAANTAMQDAFRRIVADGGIHRLASKAPSPSSERRGK